MPVEGFAGTSSILPSRGVPDFIFLFLGFTPLKITERDEANAASMLGTDDIPDEVLREIDATTRLYHRAGGSGPIGPAAVACCVRRAGFMPPADPLPRTDVNWGVIPSNGSFLVDVKIGDEWRRGVFFGRLSGASVSVLLDGDEDRREFSRLVVRPHEAPIEWKGLLKGTNLHVEVNGGLYEASYVSKHGHNVKVMLNGNEKVVRSVDCKIAG